MKIFIALICLSAFAASTALAQCTFEILVKTGDRSDAGTDARVSLQVSSSGGSTLDITNLESWGQMSAGRDYFETGNLDRFRGTGQCMSSEPCKMVLTSDGSGNKAGWYVDYVIVNQFAQGSLPSMRHKWAVDRWLAIDEAPQTLSVDLNACGAGTTGP